MPELPEVETIKTELAPHIIGRRISGVTVFWDRIVREPSIEEFRSRITGQKITDVARRGKYLLVSLSSGDLLIIHLKMSGSLLIADSSAEPPKYTQAILSLNNNTRIFFRDPRKFGLMRLVKDRNHVIGKLGPEPLEPDFTPGVLARLLARRTAPIKALLCDQNLIAGVGNMYADEALFLARIHPLRPGRSLTKKEIERLYHAIRKVLVAGIGKKGASVLNYYRPDGTLGTAHFEFKVAHGKGKNCPNCGTPIARLAIRGRGSYFCPRCQPAN
jgi:formamidopyrimidine-DNA glycosylase